MWIEFAYWVVWVLQGYLAAGLLFALAFIGFGARRVDPAAADSGWGFRLIILPGTVALWPWLLRRWLGGLPPPEERNAHRSAGGSEPR